MTAPGPRSGWPLDLACMLVLLSVGAFGFRPSYGGWTVVLVSAAAIVIGLAIALLGAARGWSVLTVAATTVGAYLLLAGPVVAPSTTIAGVLPGLDTFSALARAAVQVWMDVVTVQPPLGDRPWLLAAPILLGLVSAVLAGSLALRSRRPWLALLPVLAMLVGPILLGTHEALAPLVQGAVLGAVALGWVAWRSTRPADSGLADTGQRAQQRDARSMGRRRLATGSAMVAAAGLAGVFVTPLLVSAEPARHTLRDVVEPPLDLRGYASPLVGYRMYVKDRAEQVIFTVDGLPAGERVRLAVLDGYDGVVYDVATNPSAPFQRVGTVIESSRPAESQQATVTVGDYAGVWMPAVGDLRAVTIAEGRSDDLADQVFHSRAGDVLMSPVGLAEGDRYTLEFVPGDTVSDAELEGRPFAQLQTPEVAGVPDAVAAMAAELVGDADQPIDRIRALQVGLSSTGYFSNGLEGQSPSRAGHTAERISTLLVGDEMVGDDEQYAVAMALMARSLGAPARVVMGFYPEDAAQGEVSLTGADTHAWVEVAFEGLGWVPFDPTPPPDQVVQEQTPEPQNSPRPQALDPPPPPEEPAELPEPSTADEGEALAEDEPDEEESASLWVWIPALVISVPVLLLSLTLLLIAVLKRRRYRRRARASRPSDRVSGGWSEVLDSALDLGVDVPASATRREAAEVLGTHLRGARATALAVRADAGTFDAREPTAEELEQFWAEVDSLRKDMSGAVGPWQRVRARFSLASLRRTQQGHTRQSGPLRGRTRRHGPRQERNGE